MDTEKKKDTIGKSPDEAKSKVSRLEISSDGLKSETADANKALAVDVPNIRLAPEQIEEIHTDEYSLMLFYAIRIEPKSLGEIKREFPEPEPKKAQSVMDRFVKVGLVHITPDGNYYSNFPENYINYSHYRYDADLEARKDSKVFRLMKDFTGDKEYWKDKAYFSMDAFYSQEQTAELLEMFKQIKLKAKHFANDNAKKKTTKGMRFRRLKFYDMTFAFLLALSMTFLGFMAAPAQARAGGNDPGIMAFNADIERIVGVLSVAGYRAGGNDPSAAWSGKDEALVMMASLERADSSNPDTGGGGHEPDETDSDGGGGHDPTILPGPRAQVGGGGHDPGTSCILTIEGQQVAVKSPEICRLKVLLDFVEHCGQSRHPVCLEASQQLDALLWFIQHRRLK